MLKLYPELDKSSVRYLLRNGRRVPTSETDLVQVAQTLLDLGLVELKRRQYLKCVNQADDDFLDADDPDCEGRIPLDEGPPYKCPDCGRSLEYPGIDKEIFAELELNLRPEGIRAYLGKAVAALSTIARVEPVDQPALRVEFADGRALILALLDYTGRRWRAGGADERIIHAYVLASTIIKLSQEELQRAFHLELADILASPPAWLGQMLAEAARPKSTAFISYAHADGLFVDRLAQDLVAGGVEVWLDRWQIKVGARFVDEIQQAIQDNDYLVVVLSPNSVESEWVRQELSAALVKQLNSRQIVVAPVLYRDCPLPPFLQDKHYADCRAERYELGLQDLLRTLTAGKAATRPTPA